MLILDKNNHKPSKKKNLFRFLSVSFFILAIATLFFLTPDIYFIIFTCVLLFSALCLAYSYIPKTIYFLINGIYISSSLLVASITGFENAFLICILIILVYPNFISMFIALNRNAKN